MKKINIYHIPCVCCFLLLTLLFIGCTEDESSSGTIRFEIDCENSSIEGSYVQNASLSSLNTFNLHYLGGGASATVSAPEINGVYIQEQEVNLESDSSVKIPIVGKPIEEGKFTLKIEVVIGGRSYYCGQIFEVVKDTDPNAPIVFTLAEEYKVVKGLVEVVEIPFTVDPPMASIILNDKMTVNGLNVKVETDKKTGNGKIILTPGDDFTGGELGLDVSFGMREVINVVIETTPFTNGDGTQEEPFEVDRVELIKKIRYLIEDHFKLTADISLDGVNWTPVGTEEKPFMGSLDGNGKTISDINLTGENYIALFAYTAEDAKISNLTIAGSVTGVENVAGLVAQNKGTIENCKAPQMSVTGVNYLSALVAENEGTILSSLPDEVLTFTNFPAMISDITSQVTRTLNYSPATAIAEITTIPENITASISGNVLTLAPGEDFLGSEMGITVTYGNLTSLEKTIQLCAEEQFDDGDGTITNPFLISKASQFNKIRSYPESNFKMTADIDLTDLEEPWSPIETFSGSIDGGNHQVKNLTFKNAILKGGVIVNNTGDIRNIAFPGVDIETNVGLGVIIGNHRNGVIENIVVKGSVKSTYGSGGGTGINILGGIIGEIMSGEIKNAYSNLSMVANCNMVGGIVGRAITSSSLVQNCTSEGSILMEYGRAQIGGIVGRGETGVIIRNCYSSMQIQPDVNVSGVNGVGGIFGANNNNDMRIEECMFTGSINGGFSIGGIAGFSSNIYNCLVEGSGVDDLSLPTINVTGTIQNASGGGIVGAGKVALENCIVRNAVLRGGSNTNNPIGGISSNFQNNGYVKNSIVSNVLLNSGNTHGIAGNPANGSGKNENNYTAGILYYDNGIPTGYDPVDDPNGLDGGQKEAAELTQAFYQSLGFDFTNIWDWKDGKPILRNVGYKGSIPTDI